MRCTRQVREGPEALAYILVAYPKTHNLDAAAAIHSGIARRAQRGVGTRTFQPLGADIQDGKPVTSAEIAKVTDPNLRQVLEDELLSYRPGPRPRRCCDSSPSLR